MSAQSTQYVFGLLSVANLPAKSWGVQLYENHARSADSIQVTAYGHTLDTNGLVSLTFTVNHSGTIAAFAGQFDEENGANQIVRDGASTPLTAPADTRYVPIDAGTGTPTPDLPLQVWYRWNEGPNLRELRFATTIHSPVSIPAPF